MSSNQTASPIYALQDKVITIAGEEYIAGPALKQHGDNPAFVSWPLAPRSQANYPIRYSQYRKVLKLPAAPVEGPCKEEVDRQIAFEQSAVDRMEGINTVPPYDLAAAKSVLLDGKKLDAILVRDFIHGTLLSKWMELYEQQQAPANPSTPRVFFGLRNTDDWFTLAAKLIEALVPIHNERLVHGDLRPRSIILRNALDEKGRIKSDLEQITVVYLDTEEDVPASYPAGDLTADGTFRRKYDSPSILYEKRGEAGDFKLASKASAQWFANTDIFSLGMILFELACGSAAELAAFIEEKRVYPNSKGRDDTSAPNQPNRIQGPAWFQVGGYRAKKGNRQLRDAIYDKRRARLTGLNLWVKETAKEREDFIRMREVILACLRSNASGRATDLTAIRHVLETFRTKTGPKAGMGGQGSPAVSAAKATAPASWETQIDHGISQLLEERGDRLPMPLASMIVRRKDDLVQRLQLLTDPQCGFLRIAGRDAMVEAMTFLLNNLNPSQSFQAVVAPSFFSPGNMGLHGRVTAALQLAALRGAAVEWIIIVNNEELYNTKSVTEVLQQHNAAWHHIQKFLNESTSTYGIYYKAVPPEEYNNLLRDQMTSLCLGEAAGAYESLTQPVGKGLLIAPDYHGEQGEIAAMRLWPALGAGEEQRHRVRRTELARVFGDLRRDALHIKAFYR